MVRPNTRLAARYIDTAEALLGDMRGYSGDWDWLRKHIMPRTQTVRNDRPPPPSGCIPLSLSNPCAS